MEASGAAFNGPKGPEGLWVAHESKEGGIQPHLQSHYAIRVHGCDHCSGVSGGCSRRDDLFDSVEVFPLKFEAHRPKLPDQPWQSSSPMVEKIPPVRLSMTRGVRRVRAISRQARERRRKVLGQKRGCPDFVRLEATGESANFYS